MVRNYMISQWRKWNTWDQDEDLQERVIRYKGHLAPLATLIDGAWDDLAAIEECEEYQST